jgi:hypothetical protein
MADNISMTGSNTQFSYSGNTADLRCSELDFTYTVNSTESHAREHRAFYPHRRSQGSFSLTIDNNQWEEFQSVIAWFRNYATNALNLNNLTPPPMTVSMPSRNFLRLGIPTTGMSFGDYVGSMVFSPKIVFVSVSDPGDPSTGILDSSQVSGTDTSLFSGADTSLYFYPDSMASSPGVLTKYLYDQATASLPSAATVSADINAGIAPPPILGATPRFYTSD